MYGKVLLHPDKEVGARAKLCYGRTTSQNRADILIFHCLLHFFFSCWSESNSRSTTKKIRSNQIFTVCMKQPQSFPRLGHCVQPDWAIFHTYSFAIPASTSQTLHFFQGSTAEICEQGHDLKDSSEYSQSRSTRRLIFFLLHVPAHCYTTWLWH